MYGWAPGFIEQRRITLNQEVKDLWIAALRSDDYKQAKGVLQGYTKGKELGHCCLGVLCDLAIKAGVAVYSDDMGYGDPNDEDDFNDSVLPLVVRQWAGLHDADPFIHGSPDEYGECQDRMASSWNDKQKSSFEEIANMIEISL